MSGRGWKAIASGKTGAMWVRKGILIDLIKRNALPKPSFVVLGEAIADVVQAVEPG